MQLERPLCRRELAPVFDQLHEIIVDGVSHGFFECTVACEVMKGRKRRLTIKAGKSYQFILPQEELER